MSYDDDIYRSYTAKEFYDLPTVYRSDLFKDQVVLVTGGAGGIGKACSVLFGKLGATVVTCGRSQEKLDLWEQEMASVGISCSSHAMTIRDPDQVSVLFDAIWQQYGRLDHLINNAGGQFPKAALDLSPKGWKAVVETNLDGTWYMMQAAAKRWVEHEKPGNIVNMATLTGCAFVGLPHTAAARAGAINLAKTLSVEWAPYKIRINSLAIGHIASPGLLHYPPEAKPSFDHNSMRRMGKPLDIAEGAVYLSANSGNFVTGTILTVDGGEDVWGEYWASGKPDYFKVDE